MNQTPWTRKALPPDRTRPNSHAATPRNSANSKGKNTIQEQAKSREVRRLESLLSALRTSTGSDKDPKGGCFCQAQQHSLSAYSPIRRACGLILCSINQPYYPCPHCATPLLTAVNRGSLMAQLEPQISNLIAKETWEREQAVEEARKAAGAFPTLAGASAGSIGQPSPVSGALRPMNQTHKVLSLNSKTKKVTVSSYSTTPVPSRPVSRGQPVEEEEVRVPPPPVEVIFARKPIDPARPWADLRGDSAKYVAVSRVDDEATLKGTGRKRRRNKGKLKEPESVDDGGVKRV